MHAVACVKQVPRTHAVSIDPETNTLDRSGVESEINPLDLHAVEAAAGLAERCGGRATAVSMGPPQAAEAVREALARGCSRGILLSDGAFAGSDSYATSKALALAVRRLDDVDLVLCGKQATDGDTGQVGPGLAAHLDWRQAAYVREIREVGEDELTACCQADRGVEVRRVPLPAVLTVLKDLNRPRFPSLVDCMEARRADVETWTAAELGGEAAALGLDGSPTRVQRVFSPSREAGGVVWDDPPDEAARKLADALEDEALI